MLKRDLMDGYDAFWDLESLVPPRKRKAAPAPSFASSVTTAEVSSAAEPKRETDGDECRFSSPPPAQADVREQVSELPCPNNRFISRVRLFRRSSDYRFYGQFCRDAVRLLYKEGEACPFVPYFSYIPQYAQLTPEQLAYYLYWRSCVRRGEFLHTEESYFYLYIYEIINLPEFIDPKEGLSLLCDVWEAYRASMPRIDKFMVEWVMDYCLVHSLSCPLDRLRPFLPTILQLASHKEFYLGGMGDSTREGTETALAFLSLYRFRESRYAKEKPAVFEEYIPAAMSEVLSYLFSKEESFHRAARTTRVHEAFCGSLCAQNVRCRIELTYYSVRDLSYLRSTVTAAVKYAENKLRATLSVKSRLAVLPLEQEIRECIDAFFARRESLLRPAEKAVEVPAYERLYDAPTESRDLSRAAEIEQNSWATTRTLVSEEEWAEIQNASKNEPCFAAEHDFAPKRPQEQGLPERENAYLRLLLSDDRAGVRALLSEAGILEDELVASVNERSMERIGDVVLEAAEEGYALLPDYLEEVSEWIR